jgi:hypothetical protein
MNHFFAGQSFSTVAYFIFYEFQVVFFGVGTRTKDDQRHLLLNPGKSYELQQDDECYFIAQSERDVHAIEKMVSLVTYSNADKHSQKNKTKDKFSNAMKVHQDLFDRVLPAGQFGFRRSESYIVTSLDDYHIGSPEAHNRTRKRKL